MIRLFLKLYTGVLLVLVVSWGVQSYVSRYRTHVEAMRILESLVAGGARLSRETLESVEGSEARDRRLADINALFDYQAKIYPAELAPQSTLDRFAQGDDIVADHPKDNLIYATPLGGGDELLVFGPHYIGGNEPEALELMIGLGAVLLVAAGAIAVLLRPVAVQLHQMENTAAAIAGGDLSARVEENDLPSVTPLARAFNTMADRVERLLRTQRELLQVVSHELRTPLSRIHFAVDLVRDTADEAARQQRLDALSRAADELDTLVAELLQYIRIETGQVPLVRENLSLRSLVQEVIEEQSLTHPAIEYRLGEHLQFSDLVVNGDRHRLKRAIGNVAGNASRFAASTVAIDAVCNDEGLQIDIDDDGPGINEADWKRVFEPFVRCEEVGSGSGLGLALVHRIIDRHNGSVHCAKSPLGGARFRITLPALTVVERQQIQLDTLSIPNRD